MRSQTFNTHTMIMERNNSSVIAGDDKLGGVRLLARYVSGVTSCPGVWYDIGSNLLGHTLGDRIGIGRKQSRITDSSEKLESRETKTEVVSVQQPEVGDRDEGPIDMGPNVVEQVDGETDGVFPAVEYSVPPPSPIDMDEDEQQKGRSQPIMKRSSRAKTHDALVRKSQANTVHHDAAEMKKSYSETPEQQNNKSKPKSDKMEIPKPRSKSDSNKPKKDEGDDDGDDGKGEEKKKGPVNTHDPIDGLTVFSDLEGFAAPVANLGINPVNLARDLRRAPQETGLFKRIFRHIASHVHSYFWTYKRVRLIGTTVDFTEHQEVKEDCRPGGSRSVELEASAAKCKVKMEKYLIEIRLNRQARFFLPFIGRDAGRGGEDYKLVILEGPKFHREYTTNLAKVRNATRGRSGRGNEGLDKALSKVISMDNGTNEVSNTIDMTVAQDLELSKMVIARDYNVAPGNALPTSLLTTSGWWVTRWASSTLKWLILTRISLYALRRMLNTEKGPLTESPSIISTVLWIFRIDPLLPRTFLTLRALGII